MVIPAPQGAREAEGSPGGRQRAKPMLECLTKTSVVLSVRPGVFFAKVAGYGEGTFTSTLTIEE